MSWRSWNIRRSLFGLPACPLGGGRATAQRFEFFLDQVIAAQFLNITPCRCFCDAGRDIISSKFGALLQFGELL